jgi:hypothetical protein
MVVKAKDSKYPRQLKKNLIPRYNGTVIMTMKN